MVTLILSFTVSAGRMFNVYFSALSAVQLYTFTAWSSVYFGALSAYQMPTSYELYQLI